MSSYLFEKKVNKLLVGFVIGWAIFGAGMFWKTPKGQKLLEKFKLKLKWVSSFFWLGFKEFKKKIFKFKN